MRYFTLTVKFVSYILTRIVDTDLMTIKISVTNANFKELVNVEDAIEQVKAKKVSPDKSWFRPEKSGKAIRGAYS